MGSKGAEKDEGQDIDRRAKRFECNFFIAALTQFSLHKESRVQTQMYKFASLYITKRIVLHILSH